MKRCVKCGEMKPLFEFYRMAGMRDGHRNDCKQCNLAYQAAKRHANPQPNRDRARRWQQANPERVAAHAAAYRASGRKRISDRKSYLKRRFGLTIEEDESMLQAQNAVCALCHRPPRAGSALHVDHDHETGRVRGLLCFTCNNALGDFEDDAVRLREAARYVESYEPPLEPLIRRRVEELKRVRLAGERG
ncbi:MAG TPA: endonuclease VII domain-containing protein [Acidimicrobiales bacterium]|nr:endonuclease VII domain-containing protein [Acidimicrobiales bacterium]